MGIKDFFKEITPIESASVKRAYKEEVFYVVGVAYCIDNIKKLTCSNKDYRNSAKTNIADGLIAKKIFQYTYINKPVKLVPEPTNLHDKNAIMVLIAGEKVGYISADENMYVKNILSKCDIKFISSYISGGKYKVVSQNGHVEKEEDNIRIKIKIGYSK